MSMYTLLRNNPVPTHKEMESAFEGKMETSRKLRPCACNYDTDFIVRRSIPVECPKDVRVQELSQNKQL